jgi:hypothetical protein
VADSLQEALDAKRAKYEDECAWQKFLLESFLGCGGYQGRVKQPPAGWWGSAAEAYSSFLTLTLHGAEAFEMDTYLDRHIREDAEKFGRRAQVAHYLNYVRPITELKISYVVRKMHTRTGVPKEIEDWIERTGYDTGFRRRALIAAVLGWFHVIVDKPEVPASAQTAAQAGNIDPYITVMLPCALYDYEVEDGTGELVWAKYCQAYSRRATFDAHCVLIRRYTIWTRTEFVVYETEEVNSKVSAPEQKQKRAHKYGCVPAASWRANTSVEDPVKADSLNADIAVEARRLFNIYSEFDEHIRGQAFALLVLPQSTAPSGEGEKAAEVGVENGLIIDPNQKNVPYYLAPPADLAETFETRIERSVIEIFRMARVEYTRASGVKTSAQSKSEEFEQTNLAIADFAASLAQADRETLILVGLAMGLPRERLDKITCQPHDSYATEDLNDELEGVISAAGLPMGVTFKSELLKRLAGRMLPNLDAVKRRRIASEIDDAAVKAEQEKAALDKEPPPVPDPKVVDPDDEDESQRDAA